MEGSKIDSLIQLTKWKVGIWQSKIKYYCQKHEKLIWRDCYIKFHMKWELIHSIDTKLICSVFSNLVSKLDEIYDYNSKSDFSSRFEDLNDELKKYFDNLDEIKWNLTGLKAKYKDKMFAQIYDKILKLYKEFLSSQLYIEYLMDKDSVISSPYSIVDVSKIQKDNTNKPLEDTKKDEVIESLQRKVEVLEDKIIFIEQNVKENLKWIYSNEDWKTDLSINERESNIIYALLGYYSNEFDFNESSVLKIDMSIDRQYDIIKFLAHNKIRIPNIYGSVKILIKAIKFSYRIRAFID